MNAGMYFIGDLSTTMSRSTPHPSAIPSAVHLNPISSGSQYHRFKAVDKMLCSYRLHYLKIDLRTRTNNIVEVCAYECSKDANCFGFRLMFAHEIGCKLFTEEIVTKNTKGPFCYLKET